MVIFLAADPLTRLTMEMVSHTLCADQTQQLRIDFQVDYTKLSQSIYTFHYIAEATLSKMINATNRSAVYLTLPYIALLCLLLPLVLIYYME